MLTANNVPHAEMIIWRSVPTSPGALVFFLSSLSPLIIYSSDCPSSELSSFWPSFTAFPFWTPIFLTNSSTCRGCERDVSEQLRAKGSPCPEHPMSPWLNLSSLPASFPQNKHGWEGLPYRLFCPKCILHLNLKEHPRNVTIRIRLFAGQTWTPSHGMQSCWFPKQLAHRALYTSSKCRPWQLTWLLLLALIHNLLSILAFELLVVWVHDKSHQWSVWYPWQDLLRPQGWSLSWVPSTLMSTP